jgi:hypothetical protein
MKQKKFSKNRRDAIRKIIPLTALSCLACEDSIAKSLTLNTNSAVLEDLKILVEKTYSYHYGTFIPIFKALSSEMGAEEFIAFLTKVNIESKEGMIASITKDMLEKDINTLATLFENMLSSSPYNLAFTVEITEQTDKVLEVTYTECLAAKLLRSMNAADIGQALHCSGTKAVGPAINPNISVTNPKSLMKGDDICIERFTLNT